jgi:Protein of unknown function, DUF547
VQAGHPAGLPQGLKDLDAHADHKASAPSPTVPRMPTRSPLTQRRPLLVWGCAQAATLVLPLACAAASSAASNFDHQHLAWTALLRKHVVLKSGSTASQLRYAAMAADRQALKAYLAQLSTVSRVSFDAFAPAQQMAFLINAYNAFTVDLVLTRYPKLKSIKELGSFLQLPWKKKFVGLFNDTVSLDYIEHDLLRERGRYDDWRIHFALNCASIGCPMLREEAFVPERLEAQLQDQAQRFLSDRSRNRWNSETGELEVSKIFDWYGEDFTLGHKGVLSLVAFLAQHAERLSESSKGRALIREQRAPLVFLDYDWRLNDVRR